ncbi:magnesium chelatase domain-containing protein [Planococcus sp. ANT_H30]|uniref:magnesium chelatase domain-containing protein n=1 Tax=Planococcus sp. ANT_H30 TaxID=2597347 RepID=UPI00165DACB0|nr:magnesium chelatase domain-containing protein [Planococcus sp. ANT_H30]
MIRVEATVREDKEQCVIIGLPDVSIKESRERILNCLHALKEDIDMKKITIHLSPADVKKQGTSYDAAMLLAVLQAMTKKPLDIPEKTCFIAALTLNGELTTFHSMIPTIHQALSILKIQLGHPFIASGFNGVFALLQQQLPQVCIIIIRINDSQ